LKKQQHKKNKQREKEKKQKPLLHWSYGEGRVNTGN